MGLVESRALTVVIICNLTWHCPIALLAASKRICRKRHPTQWSWHFMVTLCDIYVNVLSFSRWAHFVAHTLGVVPLARDAVIMMRSLGILACKPV